MKERIYTSGITIFFGQEMYAQLSEEAHRKCISRSQLVRDALSVYLRKGLKKQEETTKSKETENEPS